MQFLHDFQVLAGGDVMPARHRAGERAQRFRRHLQAHHARVNAVVAPNVRGAGAAQGIALLRTVAAVHQPQDPGQTDHQFFLQGAGGGEFLAESGEQFLKVGRILAQTEQSGFLRLGIKAVAQVCGAAALPPFRRHRALGLTPVAPIGGSLLLRHFLFNQGHLNLQKQVSGVRNRVI